MTDTTFKWGEAPGEFKSQKDAQRAKTKQKVRSRTIRKGSKGGGPLIRSSEALDRSFRQGGPKGKWMDWGVIARSIAKHLHKINPGGRSAPRGSGGGKTQPWKTEIPKKLTRNY